MTKYKLSKQELQDHWDDQIRFIQKSIKEFDRGDEKEAQRLATHLRVLFHETQKSKSIFGQLKPQIIFYSSGDLYTPSNLFTSWTLLDLMVSPEGIKYNAKSNNQSRCFFLMFNDWWNEIIFDDKKNKFTRRDIVTYVANQDGGAHVDPELDESYATLTKMNSLGWTDYNGNKPLNNPAYQAIRTIANEVLYSIAISASGLKNRKKQKGKEFEMRIVDNFGRRYKWSKTEITCSLETMELVFQDKVEKRTLYIDEYKMAVKLNMLDLKSFVEKKMKRKYEWVGHIGVHLKRKKEL